MIRYYGKHKLITEYSISEFRNRCNAKTALVISLEATAKYVERLLKKRSQSQLQSGAKSGQSKKRNIRK
jgi:hypothetical protein